MISKSGRSRAWINGTPVTLNQLQDLGSLLIEIHGQNEHIRLNQPAERFRLLDYAGGYEKQLARVSDKYRDWRAAHSELERLRQSSVLDPAEIELLAHQLAELETFALPGDEVKKLEQEQNRLSRGNEFQAALEFASNSLADTSNSSGTLGIVEQINLIVTGLNPISDADGRIGETIRMLEEAAINCEEARQNIQRISSQVDLSPERLATVEQQMSQLYALARKHRVAMNELLQARDSLQERIEASRSLETRLVVCEEAVARSLETYREAALELHTARLDRAQSLSMAVTEAMQGLAMEGGQFEIVVEHQAQGEPSNRGSDRIALRVTATPGVSPGPLSKVASGGELSRISLAIKVAHFRMKDVSSAAGAATPIEVFDEVDAGVGGDAANAVGRLLRSVAEDSQTLCVTHLAQVAARAHHQIKIEKLSDKDKVSVEARQLATVAREEEIARMLSGTVSDNSLAHARELIESSAA